MAENSKIEWTDHTFNAWIGCSKVSPGCANCYAEQTFDLRYGRVQWGPSGTRSLTSEANWKLPLRWNKQAEREGRRYRVFCSSLSDVFEDWHGPMTCHKTGEELVINDNGHVWPVGWPSMGDGDDWGQRTCTMNDVRARLFRLIKRTRNLDWLLLTKRPENVCQFIGEGTGRHSTAWLADCNHVWIGTSIENQETADERIPHLLKIPAAVRFLSIEPLLGSVFLYKWLPPTCANWQCQKCLGFQYYFERCHHCGEGKEYLTGSHVANKRDPGSFTGWTNRQPIDWVIVGGESGPNARPMHPDWARSLRDQCVNAGVPFLFKQWGEWVPYEHDAQPPFLTSQHGDFIDAHLLPSLTDRINEVVNGWFLDVNLDLYRNVGKKSAGRLLDGREWNEMPQAMAAAP